MGQVPCCCGTGGRPLETTGLTPRPGLAFRQHARHADLPRELLSTCTEADEFTYDKSDTLDAPCDSNDRRCTLPTPCRLRTLVALGQAGTCVNSQSPVAMSSSTSCATAHAEAGNRMSSEAAESLSSESDYSDEEGQHLVHIEKSGTPQATSLGPLELPSIGSASHQEGTCKRCCFFPRGRCTNGSNCEFCHFDHDKRIRKSKNARRLAKLVAQAEAKLLEATHIASPAATGQFVATPTSSDGGSCRADLEQSCHAQHLGKSSLHAGAASFKPSWQGEQQARVGAPPVHEVAASQYQHCERHASCQNVAYPQGLPAEAGGQQGYFATPTVDQYGPFVHQGLKPAASCSGWPSGGVVQATNFSQGSHCQEMLAFQSVQCMQAYGWAGAQQTQFLEMGGQEHMLQIRETCTLPQALPMHLGQSAVQLPPR
eukprot:TRINITY_DN13012_c0_g1_i2.p1 TRINITY_DN13012_c0_g1~~TRINITY_DN13012_c0_g1_i2.p1  ORF type:complete len:428 (-),score=70.25 TRINITY_DN13012_c0_g1_i2:117-1400(-)